MRDIVLVLGMAFYVPMAMIAPAAGLLCWEWFSIMSPHREVYSFAMGQPLNSVVAAATLLGWLVSRERKRWTPDLLPKVMLAWLAWMTFNSLFSPVPEQTWHYWDRIVRILVPVFLVFILMTRKARIHGMIWTLVISLGFYGVKGGGFTILNGGHNIVFGPPDSMISDNNQLALAIVLELPLLYYLWQYSQFRLLRLGILVALGLQIAMVFGSYSRGGVIALAVILLLLWLRSNRKILYGIGGIVLVGAALGVMPDSFWQRLHTLNDVNSDASFQGRLMAWHVAWLYAAQHFPFGAGFYVPQLNVIFNAYFPNETSHAAHSIYFQVLGEHGFIGLALYLSMLGLALYNASIVMRHTRGQPELAWAYDLADKMRISLIGFYVGGAALSVAYFDGYLVLIALTSTLRELVVPRRAAQATIVPSVPAVPARPHRATAVLPR